jgi:Zn-dependent protease/predicted transcriptional regulator
VSEQEKKAVFGSIKLGRILGIPIRIHTSWFLIAILLTWSLGGSYFPRAYPGWSAAAYWSIGAITAVFLFVSVLLHELGHSVLALRAKVPVKSITLFFFGGVAQIDRELPTAGAEFRIAIAGPLTSLILSGLLRMMGQVAGDNTTLAAVLGYQARINLTLALFNMIPGFPLDGGRVLRALLWSLGGSLRNATLWASRLGRGIAFLFIALGVGQFFLAGNPDGLWYAFIGWFLSNAARFSYRQVVLQDSLSGVKARNVMAQKCLTVPADLRVANLVQDYILDAGYDCFFVTHDGHFAGLITLDSIRAAGRDLQRGLTARQVMTPVDSGFRADPDEDILDLLQKMNAAHVNQVPVMQNGNLLGVITRENLWQYIRLRGEPSALTSQ